MAEHTTISSTFQVSEDFVRDLLRVHVFLFYLFCVTSFFGIYTYPLMAWNCSCDLM